MKQPKHLWIKLSYGNYRRLSGLHQEQKLAQYYVPLFKKAREMGVEGVAVPISWRSIAPFAPEQVDDARQWHTYQRLFQTIVDHRLQVIPEFVFAAAKMHSNDPLISLPDWIWGYLLASSPKEMAADGIKFVDGNGRDSWSTVSYWSRDLLAPVYERVLQGFTRNLGQFIDSIPHIQLGLGPEGELRYPQVTPVMGKLTSIVDLPCFASTAQRDFYQFLVNQLGSVHAWSAEASDVEPDHLVEWLLHQDRAEIDPHFLEWYNGVLMDYGYHMLSLFDSVFSGDWAEKSLGLRFPRRQPDASAEQDYLLGLRTTATISSNELVEKGQRLLPETIRTRLLCTMRGSDRDTDRDDMICAAAETLGIRLLAENSPQDELNHPQWDELLSQVIRHPVYHGWYLNNLGPLLDQNDTAEVRIRQAARLRYSSDSTVIQRHKQVRVMGPLHLKVLSQNQLLEDENWLAFEEQVRSLRRLGVTAVSTDLWWGLVEGRAPGEYDWSYYDRTVETLAAYGMHWVPILSFHQAGGNVNDDFSQTIPLWLWGRLLQENRELHSILDLQYVSETGDGSMEYISLWADPYVLPYYRRFMVAFRDHYQPMAGLIDEINVSMGPAGELRYPSYNAHDWGSYPNRGTMQCYSPLARRDLIRYLEKKYRDIEHLNAVFQKRYRGFDQVQLPNSAELFENKNYMYNPAGREIIAWYNHALIEHGRKVLEQSLAVFSEGPFAAIPIGLKIPGIHWGISDPDTPRVSEVTAGLIASNPELGPQDRGEYKDSLQRLIPVNARSRLALHFTCLEMINKPTEGFSQAEDLVNWFADAAQTVGVSLMGENALAGELYGKQGWTQILRALNRQPGYDGITLLRMQNLFDDSPTPMKELRRLINRLY